MKLLYVIGIIALVGSLIIFLSWVFFFILGIAVMMLMLWICGVPVKVEINGETRVYRWTKRIK